MNTFGCQVFSVAGPTLWNSLPDRLCDPASERAEFNDPADTRAVILEARVFVIQHYSSYSSRTLFKTELSASY